MPALPNRWGLIAPWAIFVLMLLGWTVYWFVVSSETERHLMRAKAGMADGSQLAFSQMQTSGFPFRLQVQMRDVVFTGPNGGYRIAAPTATLAVNVLNTEQLLFFADSPLRVQTAAQDWTITAALIEASARNRAGVLSEARLVATKPVFSAPNAPNSSADKVSLAVRPDPADAGASMIGLNVEGWAPKLVGLEGFGATPGSLRAGLVLENAAAIAPGQDPLGAWAQSGAQLRIEALEATIGGVHVTGKGAFGLDAQRRPVGDIALDFDDMAAGLRAVAGSSTLDPAARGLARAFLAGQGLAGGAIGATITAGAGRWRLGPLDLGAAAPVYISR